MALMREVTGEEPKLYRTGKSCLYLKSLDDVDAGALQELVAASVVHMRETHGA